MIQFTDAQYQFIEKEFGYTKEQTDALSEDKLYEMADQCFDIELEGDLKEGNKVSDRCGLASEIVTLINSM